MDRPVSALHLAASGMRAQVWLCRPTRPDESRRNMVFAVAKSRP